MTLFADVIIIKIGLLYSFLDSLCEVKDGVLIGKTDRRKMGNNIKKITDPVFARPD